MEQIMDSTGEMIGILCPGLTATRSCKLTDFLRLHFFSRLVALCLFGFKGCFESSFTRMKMGFVPLLPFMLGLKR